MERKREIAIRLKNVSKTYSVVDAPSQSIREKVLSIFKKDHIHKIHALKNVNLEIEKGEFFGILGRNGSGKSTLLKIMCKAYPTDPGGEVEIHGRFMRLSLGMGFNPQLSVRQNIYTNASILGLTFREIGERFEEIIDFSELHEFVDTQVKFLSSGMKSRLMFSIALHAEADIFLMDEFFGGVGDAQFQAKCAKVFQQSLIDGRTIVHVSHRIDTLKQYCNRLMLLDKGEVIALGTPDEVIREYNILNRINSQKQVVI